MLIKSCEEKDQKILGFQRNNKELLQTVKTLEEEVRVLRSRNPMARANLQSQESLAEP